MANPIVPQEAPIGQNLEELYQEGCVQMREKARRLLQKMDDWLHPQAPPGWEVVGFRERTVLCRFGPVTISRRLGGKGMS